MLGTAEVDYNQLLMQMDSTSGKYEDAGEQSKGHKGASLDYRKIQNLVRGMEWLFAELELRNMHGSPSGNRQGVSGVHSTPGLSRDCTASVWSTRLLQLLPRDVYEQAGKQGHLPAMVLNALIRLFW